MKILITGCRGQLGTELQRQLSEEGCAIGPLPERLRKATVIPVDVDELDITDREATINYIRRHQPDTVINCAAFTNVDGCETARDAAFKVNAIGPRNLALACEKIGARLIHVSTDYVFPGTANGGVALDECAVPAPISAYGQTKLLGEQYVERFCRRHFIVRTAWLYSYYGKNFVKTMIRLGRTHDKITVVNDQLGNPTNAVDLAYHILKLAVSHDYGIYHCTGNGICRQPRQCQPPGVERPGEPYAALHRRRRDARLAGCPQGLFCKLEWRTLIYENLSRYRLRRFHRLELCPLYAGKV